MRGVHFTEHEKHLAHQLRLLASQYGNNYTEEAGAALTQILFTSLANHRFLPWFFPNGLPTDRTKPWRLSEAQGAIEGSEYTEAARGKRCGHIFKSEEATYSCRTCQADPTCVLCTKCFHASDHEGHQVYVQMSAGTTGCCDCGDDEAWTRPLQCSIHSSAPKSKDSVKHDTSEPESVLPRELQASIRQTISRAFDFLCDVFSCCPEEMRSPKQEEPIRSDEERSRLKDDIYGGPDMPDDTFALVLWNDEKHTVYEVSEKVSQACKEPRSYGTAKAAEVDQVGRSIISRSKNLKKLLEQARRLAQIKVTVTIRSTRDTFREEMCNGIVQWLADIAGCSVGGDHDFMMNAVCEEMLRSWRVGSQAFNAQIAMNGIVDHAKSDDRLRLSNIRRRALEGQVAAARQARLQDEMARLARQPQQTRTVTAQEETRVATRVTAIARAAGIPVLQTANNENDEANEDEDPMDVDEDGGLEVIEGELEGDDVLGEDEIIDVLTAASEGPPQFQAEEDSDEDDVVTDAQATSSTHAPSPIPRTPRQIGPTHSGHSPSYWNKRSLPDLSHQKLALHERMDERVRLDHLILFDLRMWKTLRYNLSHLYISTVISVPSFKRHLGLRFAALYTLLAQLYLVADREPEHSIIHLSLQMLTTPSITAEIVERSNFLTRLLAILYTFLTKRQVGNPEEVDLKSTMSFESGVMTNRRIFHFFQDMRYLLDSPYVHDQICNEERYLSQFLDFAQLSQGICPNVRAVGEHVEYESETWYAAGNIVRDITRLSRQFCESFRWTQSQDATNICRALRYAAKAAIISSLGLDHARFPQAEHREVTKFKDSVRYQLPSDQEVPLSDFLLVDFKVETSPMSFHHALHYTLSWLIDSGKSMSAEQLRGLLSFDRAHLAEASALDALYSGSLRKPGPNEYLLALFDIPLRVCAWLAQMRAGMWVRNGMSLRHQMHFYRGIGHRDVSHRRDLYLLQVAAVVCHPGIFLASMLDRFALDGWCQGDMKVKGAFDDYSKMTDMAEEMVHLLIVLLTDRILLLASEQEMHINHMVAKQEIIQALCFKPLTFSDLNSKLTEKVSEMEGFQEVLRSLTKYRAPEGLSDSGTFQLKEECLREVDPYSAYYSKSQREESETICRTHIAKITGQPLEQVVFEPHLRPIETGLFTKLAAITCNPLFSRFIASVLVFLNRLDDITAGEVTSSRAEGLLQAVMHLILIAVIEDRPENVVAGGSSPAIGFVQHVLEGNIFDLTEPPTHTTIMEQMLELVHVSGARFTASKHRVLHVLRRIHAQRTQQYQEVTEDIERKRGWGSTLAERNDTLVEEASEKKRQALDRQAKVMAAFKQQQNDFLQNQSIDWGVDDDVEEDVDNIMADVVEAKTWNYPSGTCIFCQEDVKEQELYGTLAFVTESNIFRTTDLGDAGQIREVLSVPTSLDHEHTRISDGTNIDAVPNASAQGRTTNEDKSMFGRELPSTCHQSGPIVTGCGHIMHFSCFQTYEAATARRHSYQITRHHPENTNKAEFVCPLCKALGNAFLPVVWKPKVCQGSTSSDDKGLTIFLDRQIPRIAQDENILKFEGEGLLNIYAAQAYVPSLASSIAEPDRWSTTITASTFSRWRLAPLLGSAGIQSPGPSTGATSSGRPLSNTELMKAYQRLLKTLSSNNLLGGRVLSEPLQAELEGIKSITLALGYSIAGVEIAQRGLEGGRNYISAIPEAVITNLRIWSETVSSYIALGGPTRRFILELQGFVQEQARRLAALPSSELQPLLCSDMFVFLAQCSVTFGSIYGVSLNHLTRLCYTAEIVKVVLAALQQASIVHENIQSFESLPAYESSPAESQRFSIFIQLIVNLCAEQHLPSWVQNPNERSRLDILIGSLVSKYATQYLRQSALLAHVRDGVDFDDNDELDQKDASELARLTHQLGLPTIDELVQSLISDGPGGDHTLRSTVSGWVTHYVHHTLENRTAPSAPRWKPRLPNALFPRVPSFLDTPATLVLPYPGIYELIPLPNAHDMLNAAAMTRRCPTTGRELDDPSICLFCGAFVCTQARCCRRESPATRQEEGGCFIHREQCGGNVGIFLNIRKCAVLMSHDRNGSWFPAPYLDRYGETDVGLRRKEQLFLNRKRYDRLYRDVWLNHGIPTAVARKLEAEVNTGGWEGI